MTIRIAKRALLVSALVFCLMIFFGTVSAVTITESPDQIKQGDTVHLTIQDLHDGDTFSVLIEGRFQVTPGKDFVFATDNFNMPISLQNGELTAYTENAQETTLLVKKGGTTASVGQDNPTGIFTHSESRDIASGTYDTLRLTGTVLPGKDSLVTRLQMSGSKSGPDNSEITFNVMGINTGSLYITVLVNGAQQLFKEITISSPGVTAGMPTLQTAVPTATVTPTPSPLGNTFTSADGEVTVTTGNVDYVGILKTDAQDVPDGWLAVTDSYTLSPDNLVFSPAADLSFELPGQAGDNDYAYFIAHYADGQWSVLPSEPLPGAISAKITGGGTYALMALRAESTIAPTGAPTHTAGLAPAVAQTEVPRIASVAHAPGETPTPVPVSSVPIIGAVLAGILIYKRYRT